MTTSELRKLFLDFFATRDHRVVRSAPLVPGNDKTLLFTNAGMVQFKDAFLGKETRAYTRATSSQRCVRAGGKHNDLENVGYTARHHTFFEMLGNFSFGDYFKREAIQFAWEFLTRDLGIPAERLWVTVYQDDDEAADIWLNEMGIDPGRFGRLGEKDNFWAMGDTGPCGPCSEIFYDHGAEVAGGPPGSPDEEGDRYVEIWNLVFMQYDRSAAGELTPLPKPSVDTGMGLERLAAVMQGVHNNYDIDLFQGLIKATTKATGHDNLQSSSLRVIADHIRACAFLIVDGVLPGNEGRGYVLRRIIRRALRHGYELGVTEPFFYRLVQPLEKEMGEAYPELTDAVEHVERVLRAEEERFAETLAQGMRLLETAMADADNDQLSGDVVFKLYDTYGFPVDLTADVARARNMEIDRAGFEQAMEGQRSRARAAQKFNIDVDTEIEIEGKTAFTGYDHLQDSGHILALISDGKIVESISAGEQGGVVLDCTPLYAESGGQVGDQGVIHGPHGVFRVSDTRKNSDAFVHIGVCESGALGEGEEVRTEVEVAARGATVLNHTATHLMHAALKKVLGTHVSQKGSLVTPEKLRFDFSHYQPVTPAELGKIEQLVNEQIRANVAAKTKVMSYDEALDHGAVALFGEKYGDRVRVLSLGEFSVELCGGTHVARTGDIGLFSISSESGVAAGIRRIEAVTGQLALDRIAAKEADLEMRVQQALEKNKALEKELQKLNSKLAGSTGDDLAAGAQTIGGIQVLACKLADGIDAKSLRDAVDRLKDKLGSAAVVLASVTGDGKVRLAAGVTKDAIDRIKAGDLVNSVATRIGGKGGGRPDFAQAGGTDPAKLDAALAGVPDWVAESLG